MPFGHKTLERVETMSLRHALLGLLARESLTGYDLTKMFDSTVGFFWSAKHSQIYPELANLTQDGLVTFEVVTQTSKPNKKVYTITEQGREVLREWSGSSSEKRLVKDPLLMRVWNVGQVDPEALLPQLQRELEENEARLEHLRAFESDATADGAHATSRDNSWLGAVMALRCGIQQSECYIDWLKWAIAQLEATINGATPAVAVGTTHLAKRLERD